MTWFTNTPTLSKRSDNQNYGGYNAYNNYYDGQYHYEGGVLSSIANVKTTFIIVFTDCFPK